MLTCYRCGAAAVGVTGTCANCGAQAFAGPYGMPGGAMLGRRNVRGLGLAAIILLGATGLADLFLAFAMNRRHSLIGKFAEGNDVGDMPGLDEVRASDHMVGAAAALVVLTAIAVVVLMICWFYAARTNAETYGPSSATLSRGWAIGGWFIPLANYVLPLIVALDIQRGTAGGRDSGTGRKVVTWAWWVAFCGASLLIFNAIGQRGSTDDFGFVRLQGLDNQAKAMVPAMVVEAVAAVLAAVFVYQVSKAQTARASEPVGGVGGFAGGFPMAPAPYGMPNPVPGAFGQPGYGQPGFGAAPTASAPQYGPPAPTAYGMPAAPAYGAGQQAPYTPVTEAAAVQDAVPGAEAGPAGREPGLLPPQ